MAIQPAFAKDYICTPTDSATRLQYGGGRYYVLVIKNDCLKLQSLSNQSDSWSWRTALTNVFGDIEGNRRSCVDIRDQGMVGSPAIWRAQKMTLTLLSDELSVGSFQCKVSDHVSQETRKIK